MVPIKQSIFRHVFLNLNRIYNIRTQLLSRAHLLITTLGVFTVHKAIYIVQNSLFFIDTLLNVCSMVTFRNFAVGIYSYLLLLTIIIISVVIAFQLHLMTTIIPFPSIMTSTLPFLLTLISNNIHFQHTG